MAHTFFDVVGIGNAIVDVLAPTTDTILEELGLNKGSMLLIDEDTAVRIHGRIDQGTERSGGSASNTMAGVASFGARAAFIGKVRNDRLGKVFQKDIVKDGVHFTTPAAQDGPSTARCLVLVTPDAERTMQTYLGASVELHENDLNPDIIRASEILYLEGYLWDAPAARQAFLTACDIAHTAGRKIAFTLSDSFCVERHRKDFLDFIAKHVDILFANEQEIIALYQTATIEEAIQKTQVECPVTLITRGSHGSMAVTSSKIWECPAEPVTKVVDTTGAGDLFAAGVFAGLAKKRNWRECLQLGSIAAAEVISHYGARPECGLAPLAAKVLETTS